VGLVGANQNACLVELLMEIEDEGDFNRRPFGERTE